MLPLIEYIIAILIVMLALVGFTLLSLRLRTSEETRQQPQEKVLLQTDDDELKFDNPPKRGLLGIFRRRERTIVD